MTILTGEFAVDRNTASAGGQAGRVETAEGVLPEDVRLYLRHVEEGESIRALAREYGCHASTILRRIRRFEARRDDPLVDNALERTAAQREARASEDQTSRILRRLAEAGAQLIVAADLEKAIVVRNDIRTAVLDRALAEGFALKGWVALIAGGRVNRYALSQAGKDALRNLITNRRGGNPGEFPLQADFADAQPVGASEPVMGMAEAAAGFDYGNQHRVWGERIVADPEDGARRRARVNIAESPLQMLARRRDKDGRLFLEPELVAAGERMREDFELAQMGPRVTQNWDRFLTAGSDSGFGGAGFGGGSEKARDRVAAALRELGPGLGDMVLRVCCYLDGIEMTERRLGWSARSGKIVLRLALMRLNRHYQETYGSGTPLIG